MYNMYDTFIIPRIQYSHIRVLWSCHSADKVIRLHKDAHSLYTTKINGDNIDTLTFLNVPSIK